MFHLIVNRHDILIFYSTHLSKAHRSSLGLLVRQMLSLQSNPEHCLSHVVTIVLDPKYPPSAPEYRLPGNSSSFFNVTEISVLPVSAFDESYASVLKDGHARTRAMQAKGYIGVGTSFEIIRCEGVALMHCTPHMFMEKIGDLMLDPNENWEERIRYDLENGISH